MNQDKGMNAPVDAASPVLRCVGIAKFFGGVRALAGVSIDLFAGQIVGLVGDNGAGKSTFIKILSGLLQPDSGQIWFDEHLIHNLTPEKARNWGIETVYQNLELCDDLSAEANVMLGQEKIRFQLGPFRFVDRRWAVRETKQRLAQLGIELQDYESPVRRFSGGQRQAIAIARATVKGRRLVIFDEPTAALGLRQTEATARLIKQVAAQKVAVILISHSLEQIFSLADRIISLRLGEVTLDESARQTTPDEVRALMSGQRRKGERR
ncbi:MAG: ATP-binding cassette domain-containing protein [Roseiarcus sp.]